MLKRIFMLGLILTACTTYASELTNFHQITQQLSAGKKITIVIHGDLCKMISVNEPEIPIVNISISGGTITYTNRFISFDAEQYAAKHLYPYYTSNAQNNSQNKQSFQPPTTPFADLIQRISGYIDTNGDSVIQVSFFNAESNQKSNIYPDGRIKCQLGDGVRIFQDIA